MVSDWGYFSLYGYVLSMAFFFSLSLLNSFIIFKYTVRILRVCVYIYSFFDNIYNWKSVVSRWIHATRKWRHTNFRWCINICTAYKRSDEYIFVFVLYCILVACVCFFIVFFNKNTHWCQSIINQLELDGRTRTHTHWYVSMMMKRKCAFERRKKYPENMAVLFCPARYRLTGIGTATHRAREQKRSPMKWFWWITESHNLKPQNEIRKKGREKL